MKGYRLKATTFVFEIGGVNRTFVSNATSYLNVIELMDLPADALLKTAITYRIYKGAEKGEFFVDRVWAMEGTLPSGKAVIEYLASKGAIDTEDYKDILDAPEVRL